MNHNNEMNEHNDVNTNNNNEIEEISEVHDQNDLIVPGQLDTTKIKFILEAGLMAAGEPMSLERLSHLFLETERPTNAELKEALRELMDDYFERSFELKELASGYCFRVKEAYSPWIARLWAERPTRYSRAFLETLALIAYRQPITRGEIEKIRGVAVSSSIIKTLQDRNFIRIVGHRDIPGKPSLYATTKEFLDHFSLQSLEDLPALTKINDLERMGELLEDNYAPEVLSMAELLNPSEVIDVIEVSDSDSVAAEINDTAEEIDQS